MIRRILVPLDGSELAGHILPQVEDLARRLPAEVWFVYVVELATAAIAMDSVGVWTGGPLVIYDQLDDEANEAARQLGTLVSEWRERGIATHSQVLWGEPALEIVDFARSHEIDLIAMSTHGRTGLDHLILGSVAERVVLETRLPVLVMRPGEEPCEGTGEIE